MNLLRCVFNTLPRRGASLPFLGVLILALAAAACESIYDDQSDCFGGIKLRFVYDYHMEPGANAFPANVDCINVYVFDNEGNFVTQLAETSDLLRDEHYRMDLSLLDPGSYNIVVYGGLACANSAFRFSPQWGTSAAAGYGQSDMTVTLPLDANGVSAKQLHNIESRTGGLFYGALKLTLTDEDFRKKGYREETVYLVKDTNNIQIILQELDDPYVIDVNDYDFQIVDDNFVIDAENRVREIASDDLRPCYKPYFSENRQTGFVDIDRLGNGDRVEENAAQPVQVACVEFSTSRLVIEHLATARLVVTHRESGSKVIDIPLIEYLCLIRGMGDSWIKSDQEFLDRQSRWNMMLFLRNGKWSTTSVVIVVNAWVVRLNNVIF